jgi:phytoene dehydrogenase-like protein
MPGSYDAIVVGGGHNGLVPAPTWPAPGARTVVLESRRHRRRRRHRGAVARGAGHQGDPAVYVMSLLPPTIIRELSLERHGYKVFPMGPVLPGVPRGRLAQALRRRRQRNHEEVSKWSRKDAEAMPRWDAWLAGLAEVLGPLLLQVPPTIGSRSRATWPRTPAAGMAPPRRRCPHDR